MENLKKVNKKYIFSYVSPELHRRVKEYCARKETTVVALLERLLEKEMNKIK